ncbi:MAG: XkdF-like putative serine protease domain-containing protein, partial [bacterium]
EIEEKAAPPDEGETRGERAEAYWKENWYKVFPKSGTGHFVWHHHWRGLSEEEAKNLSDEELMKTDHSVHGDLRLEGEDDLWGFTVFLGTTEENRKNGGDRLINLPPDDNLQGTFKLGQPKEWLKVGDPPLVVEPGGVGATSQKWSKFFMIDHGTYEMGVWREHMFEIFLHGEKLKGRFIIEYAPIGGKRIWIIDKPEDQTPYAEKHDLNDVIAELKQKGQKYLIWAKPGEKPKLIEVDKVSTEKSWFVPLIKSEEEHFVLGPFLIPDEVDLQGDVVTAEEIEKAVHKFMEEYQKIGEMHQKILPKDKATVVECYVTRGDWELNGQLIKKGTAMIGVKIHDDALWQDVRKGVYSGFSIRGRARTE